MNENTINHIEVSCLLTLISQRVIFDVSKFSLVFAFFGIFEKAVYAKH